jgi:CTP:molybdopterin cytidylyltransferase MocA
VQIPAAVVVNAAGLGSRLGLNRPKALLEVEGRPLIAWQLEMLRDVEDVRVVLGYRAAEVAEVVFSVRPDAMVVLNHDFASTGTAASFLRGAARADNHVVSLDCDLLVHPDDLRAFIDAGGPALGVIRQQSVDPVLVEVRDVDGGAAALQFSRDPQPDWWEWSGLVVVRSDDERIQGARGHVFEMVAPLLPLPAIEIRAREVDFEEEVEEMAAWIRELREEGVLA